MMINDFPRILALLRKERSLSQKQAAADLGINQALLSHYEKGKRECGLAFLVKAADYYDVSTDYLLGRSPSLDGSFVGENDIPDSDELDKSTRAGKDISVVLFKKMIISGIDVIYSLLGKVGNQNLTRAVSEYFMLSVYSCFRLTHRANPKNDSNMFGVKEEMAFRGAVAGRGICEGKAIIAANEGDKSGLPQITTASLESEYNRQATALMSLVKNSEKIINNY